MMLFISLLLAVGLKHAQSFESNLMLRRPKVVSDFSFNWHRYRSTSGRRHWYLVKHELSLSHDGSLFLRQRQQRQRGPFLFFSSFVPSDVEMDDNTSNNNVYGSSDGSTDDESVVVHNDQKQMVDAIKRELITLCAMYDRGYGITTTKVRQAIDSIIAQIESFNNAVNIASTLLAAASSIPSPRTSTTSAPPISIQGTWRMIYTTAYDVLSLQSSPLFITGPIHQVYEDDGGTFNDGCIITNVIDFIPRIQSLFPLSSSYTVPNTVVRVNVQTRTCIPYTQENNKNNNRIGLIFESVQVDPIQVLGFDTKSKSNLFSLLPSPSLTLNLPKLPSFGSSSGSSSTTRSSPGYFDVTYLDADFLIIRQNPNIVGSNGLFCLVRTNAID